MKCEGESVPVKCEWVESGLSVEVEGTGDVVTLNTDWSLGEPMMTANIDGKEVVVQVRRHRYEAEGILMCKMSISGFKGYTFGTTKCLLRCR